MAANENKQTENMLLELKQMECFEKSVAPIPNSLLAKHLHMAMQKRRQLLFGNPKELTLEQLIHREQLAGIGLDALEKLTIAIIKRNSKD